MITVSSDHLYFSGEDKLQNLGCKNNSGSKLIFKVKTNNVGVIDARPNLGGIDSNDELKISVRKNKQVTSNVKLQISYVVCNQQLTQNNFKELWTKYGKQPFSVIVNISGDKQNGESNQKIQKVDPKNPRNAPMLFKSMHMQQKISSFQSATLIPETQQIKKQQTHIADQLQNIQNQNEALQENLKKNNEQIKQKQSELIQDAKQTKPKQKNVNINLAYLFVTALVFFFIGYFLGTSQQKVIIEN